MLQGESYAYFINNVKYLHGIYYVPCTVVFYIHLFLITPDMGRNIIMPILQMRK